MRVLLLMMLLVGPLAHAQNCNGIKRTVDKFNGRVSWSSRTNNINLSKYYFPTSGDTTYTALMQVRTYSVGSYGKGVYILFENGEKLEFPEEKSGPEIFGGAPTQVIVLNLTREELIKISQTPISAIKLYI